MIPLLVVLAFQVFPPKPCILIEHEYGENISWIREKDDVFAVRWVEVAVWPDGRIIWSRPDAGKDERKLQFFEARIPMSEVQATLDRFEKADIFQFPKLFSVPFHEGYRKITVQLKRKSVEWAHWHTPVKKADYEDDSVEWNRAIPAWHLVMREAKALIPPHGKPIPLLRGRRPWFVLAKSN